MISLELLRDRPKNKGLKMELSSAPSAEPAASSVWVGEDAFGFLEPSINKCCADYKQFSHWGVTEIKWQEWLAIKEDWRRLASKLEEASTPHDYSETAWLPSQEAKPELSENFEAIKLGLSLLISELSGWIEGALAGGQSIFLRGISVEGKLCRCEPSPSGCRFVSGRRCWPSRCYSARLRDKIAFSTMWRSLRRR